MQPFKAIFFDLFWTLIEVQWDGERLGSAPLLLRALHHGGIGVPERLFLETYADHRQAVFKTWEAGIEEETQSFDKMLGFLQALGLEQFGFQGDLHVLTSELLRIHMDHIVQSTRLPAGHWDLLKAYSEKFPLALVSNFDDGPTGRKILQHHDIDQFFKAVVISADLGKRKPHARLFTTAAESLAIRPEDALMIGDSPLCDIEGAHRCGIAAAWVQRKGVGWPKHLRPPEFVLNQLTDLGKIGQ